MPEPRTTGLKDFLELETTAEEISNALERLKSLKFERRVPLLADVPVKNDGPSEVRRETDPETGWQVEITEEQRGSTIIKSKKFIDPVERLRKETTKALAEGIGKPSDPTQPSNTRYAVAVAVSRVIGIKLSSDTQQGAAIEEWRKHAAVSKKRAARIGLADILISIGEWAADSSSERYFASGVNHSQGLINPEDIKRAAHCVRWRFLQGECGGWQANPPQFISIDESLAPPSDIDILDVDVTISQSTCLYLQGLSREQQTLFRLRYAGYTQRECADQLGWSNKDVGRVWRSLAKDRDGKDLHEALTLAIQTCYRMAEVK